MTNLETEPSPLPPPRPAPIEPTERRWARSDDRVVFGVAGGLARALAIEPLLVRIAFVVLALFSGIGIVLYFAALLLLADSPLSRPPSTFRRVVGIIAVLVAARWLIGGDARLPAAGWVVAIGLLGVAVALWRGRAPSLATLPPPSVGVQTADDGGSTTDRWSSWTAQRRERPRPPHSVLGLLTMGAAAVIGATVWLANDGSSNRSMWAFGWATIVLGAGLLVGAFAGRARWLIIPALATAAAALIAAGLSFAGVGLTNRTGSRHDYFGPNSLIAPEYRTGVGDVELWMADYPSDASTSVEVGMGKVTVIVPDGARVQVDAKVGIGSIDVLGSSKSGYRRTLSLDTKQGTHVIKLRLRVGTGSITVRHNTPPGFFSPALPMTVPTVTLLPDETLLQQFGDGTVLFNDGAIQFADGSRIEPDGGYQIPIIEQRPDGSVQLENGAVIENDGSIRSPGGFVITGTRPSPGATATSLAPLLSTTTTLYPMVSTTLGVQP
jgi:phage shock protein PspC (stress-responsive transcriptional regulator)